VAIGVPNPTAECTRRGDPEERVSQSTLDGELFSTVVEHKMVKEDESQEDTSKCQPSGNIFNLEEAVPGVLLQDMLQDAPG